MTYRMRPRAPALLALLLSALPLVLACGSDTTGPCDRPHACEIEGFDLVVVRAGVVAPTAIDAVTGNAVLAPGTVDVEYVIRNRGTQESPPRLMWVADNRGATPSVSDSLPALAPGESIAARMTVTVTAYYLIGSDLARFHVAVESLDDADEDSNHIAFEVHIAVPVIEHSIDMISAVRVRVGESFGVTYRVRNLSTRAAASGLTLRLCLMTDYAACFPGYWGTFGHVDVPDLPPGAEFSISTPTSIVPAAVPHDEARLFMLSVCPSRTSWTDPYIDIGDIWSGILDCNGQQHIRVLPDYEGVCRAPLLAPGGVHVFEEHNCGHMPPSSQSISFDPWSQLQYLFHVIAIEAEAGRVYTLERSNPDGSMKLLDGDGEAALLGSAPTGSFSFQQSGRYYIVMNAGPASLSLALH
jgi:hypothetical protein